MTLDERIMFKCKWKDYDLVRVWALPTALILQRGEWGTTAEVSQFQVHETENLKFRDNPELAALYDHDTHAWDLDKVYALLHVWCEEMDV